MTTIARFLLALLVMACVALPSDAQETKPTIMVPAEKCPQYVDLLQRYAASMSRRPSIRTCLPSLDERDRLLRGMLAYGQNSSCYSFGWKGAEVVSFLQTLIDRNHAEKLRCEAWLASGRACEDGSVCSVGMVCTPQRLCVVRARSGEQPNDKSDHARAVTAPQSASKLPER